MKKSALLLAIIATLALVSCQKSKPIVFDYFIVEWEGGYMSHLTYFSVSDSSVSCDTSHLPYVAPVNIDQLVFNVPMPDSIFAKAKDLPKSIPSELFFQGSSSYGETWIDGSTTYIWASVNGKKYAWMFGNDQSKSSAAVQQFYYNVSHAFYY